MNIIIEQAKDTDTVSALDEIRSKAFNFEGKKNNHYVKNILSGRYLEYSIKADDILIGGCIVSKAFNTLYFEQIFIDPNFQKKGFGKKLINGVLNKKDEIEKHYNTTFKVSMLEDSHDSKDFYKALEYNDYAYMMRKKI